MPILTPIKKELKDSILTHGIIQPILFRQGEGESLFIVAGERRFAAAQMADLPSVPAICVEGNPSEIALVENLLRQERIIGALT